MANRRSLVDPTWDIGHSHAILVEAMAAVRGTLDRGTTPTADVLAYIDARMKEAGCFSNDAGVKPC